MGTLVGFVERAADQLAPIDGLHWKKLLASPWMATDGTGIKVLIPGLSAAHDGYVTAKGKDTDADGLVDSVDACPDDPEDVDGFQDADGCPDPDNDQDGVKDTADRCCYLAEDPDQNQDLDGCPE